jgi:hypothetical protein
VRTRAGGEGLKVCTETEVSLTLLVFRASVCCYMKRVIAGAAGLWSVLYYRSVCSIATDIRA